MAVGTVIIESDIEFLLIGNRLPVRPGQILYTASHLSGKVNLIVDTIKNHIIIVSKLLIRG